MNTTIRRFRGHDRTIVGGTFADDELAAARAVGSVNAYRLGLQEVELDLQSRAPAGWRVWAEARPCHDDSPTPPAPLHNPILMGFARVHNGDPQYPVWLYRATTE